MKKLIFFTLGLLLFLSCGPKPEKIDVKEIEGITYIFNPERSLKGTVVLEVEKSLVINPYQFEEIGLRGFKFVRDDDGEVILFNSNLSEAHRFSHRGEYLGNLIKQGQGPGEFPNYSFLNIFFMNNQIWATGAFKIAKFDKSGQFLLQNKLEYYPQIFTDDNRFFILQQEGNMSEWVSRLTLIELSGDKDESKETDFFQAENVGMIQVPGKGGFDDPWSVPSVLYAYDKKNQRMNVALGSEYKINVKNLNGDIVHVFQKSHKDVKVNLTDKKELLSNLFGETYEGWMLDVYPDTLVAVKDIKTLPEGYLAVYEVTGIGAYRIDVFDQDGRYTYILTPPEGISLEEAFYFSGGFALIEETEDGWQIYTEYRVKNLPKIFHD